MNWKRGRYFCFALGTIHKSSHHFFSFFDTTHFPLCWLFLTSAISRNLNLDPPYPFENCECVLRMDLCYLKGFDDNNNINRNNIAFTLGEFGTHFIGTKASKVHFFKKMVNLTHSYSIA